MVLICGWPFGKVPRHSFPLPMRLMDGNKLVEMSGEILPIRKTGFQLHPPFENLLASLPHIFSLPIAQPLDLLFPAFLKTIIGLLVYLTRVNRKIFTMIATDRLEEILVIGISSADRPEIEKVPLDNLPEFLQEHGNDAFQTSLRTGNGTVTGEESEHINFTTVVETGPNRIRSRNIGRMPQISPPSRNT